MLSVVVAVTVRLPPLSVRPLVVRNESSVVLHGGAEAATCEGATATKSMMKDKSGRPFLSR